MKSLLKLAGLSLFLTVSILVFPGLFQPTWLTSAIASEQNNERVQSFTIAKMTCAACPITVKKAMQRVDGVIDVDIDFDTKTAVATFDPALTNADEIAAASTGVGYPATAIEDHSQ
jgi:mercuric ion binding protein